MVLPQFITECPKIEMISFLKCLILGEWFWKFHRQSSLLLGMCLTFGPLFVAPPSATTVDKTSD